MTAAVKAIPEGYHTVTPYLILNSAGDAIAFYKKALGAEEVMRMEDPGGKIHHAEIKIGDSRIMLADEHPELQALSPKTVGGAPRRRATSASIALVPALHRIRQARRRWRWMTRPAPSSRLRPFGG